jgi:hypothetical protein
VIYKMRNSYANNLALLLIFIFFNYIWFIGFWFRYDVVHLILQSSANLKLVFLSVS